MAQQIKTVADLSHWSQQYIRLCGPFNEQSIGIRLYSNMPEIIQGMPKTERLAALSWVQKTAPWNGAFNTNEVVGNCGVGTGLHRIFESLPEGSVVDAGRRHDGPNVKVALTQQPLCLVRSGSIWALPQHVVFIEGLDMQGGTAESFKDYLLYLSKQKQGPLAETVTQALVRASESIVLER